MACYMAFVIVDDGSDYLANDTPEQRCAFLAELLNEYWFVGEEDDTRTVRTSVTRVMKLESLGENGPEMSIGLSEVE